MITLAFLFALSARPYLSPYFRRGLASWTRATDRATVATSVSWGIDHDRQRTFAFSPKLSLMELDGASAVTVDIE
jgi:hypothetical protein